MQTLSNINLTNLPICDQVWEDMERNERGRLCLKCQNTIIDFRNLSNHEIAEMHTFSNGKVCGIYRQNQLDLKLEKSGKPKRIKALALWFMGLISTMHATAQANHEDIKIVQTDPIFVRNTNHSENVTKTNQAVQDSIIISGTIKDEVGEPIAFANVHIKGTKTGTTANLDGEYYLDVTKQLDSARQITLMYTYLGYATIERQVDDTFISSPEKRKLDVIFLDEDMTLISFVVRERLPWHKRIWNRIKRIF